MSVLCSIIAFDNLLTALFVRLRLDITGCGQSDLGQNGAYKLVYQHCEQDDISHHSTFRTKLSGNSNVSEDFITTLRATGMSEKRLFNKYVLRNALIPTVTVVGSSLAHLIGGAVFIETVFSWPGMGQLLYSSISKRDYPMLSGIYLIIALSIAIMMIVVDIIYSVIDPRIKYTD